MRELFTELLRDQHTVAHLAKMMAGADIRYEMGVDETHHLVGRWARDLVLDVGRGPVRLAEMTTTARPLLLDFTEDGSLSSAADGWRDRVDAVTAHTVTAHTRDAATTGLLLRTDCYVAWATDTPRPDHHVRESLRTALTTWFGSAEHHRSATTGC